jgi:hypothetical protein
MAATDHDDIKRFGIQHKSTFWRKGLKYAGLPSNPRFYKRDAFFARV